MKARMVLRGGAVAMIIVEAEGEVEECLLHAFRKPFGIGVGVLVLDNYGYSDAGVRSIAFHCEAAIPAERSQAAPSGEPTERQ